MLRVTRVETALPPGFDALRAQAAAEGYGMIERLFADWNCGNTRFDRDGETLLAAIADDELQAIGGLTIDPKMPGALRMRRFYVRPVHRRQGIGRRLATALLAGLQTSSRVVTVNAGADSGMFWRSLGFEPVTGDGITHIRPRPRA